MASARDEFVLTLGRTAARNYITAANAACAELRVSVGHANAIKQDFTFGLRVPPALAHKHWAIEKIFEVILQLDVRDGELATRVVLPWQAVPTNIPTRG